MEIETDAGRPRPGGAVVPAGWPDPMRKRWPWSAQERQVLLDRYLAEGVAGCARVLPARTASAIMDYAAAVLGVKRQAHAPRKPSNEWIDRQIRAAFSNGRPRAGEVAKLAKRIAASPQWIYTRGAALGVYLERAGRLWSEAEDALLERHGELSITSIRKRLKAAGYTRTAGAIGNRLRLLGIRSGRHDDGTYSANALALAMGVSDLTVMRWVRACGLPADKRGADTGAWRIRPEDLREWMMRSREWDHRKCPQEWLVDILSATPAVRTARKRARAADGA